MPRPHLLPKRGSLTVAVQLALTFAAGMYAPRIRAQQIACPATGVTVTGAATNSVDPCDNAGALTINSGGTLTNTGTVRTLSGATFSNSGTLTNNGLGALTIDQGGLLENNSGGLLNNNATGFSGNDGGITVRGALRNNAGGALNNSGRLRNYRSMDNDGTLTNSSIMTVYGPNGELHNNSGGTLNNDAFLTLRTGSPLLENRAGGTVNNNGTLRLFDGSRLTNGPGAAIFNNNSGGTLQMAGSASFRNSGTVNNSGALTLDAGPSTAQLSNYGTFNNTGSLTNRSNGFAPISEPTIGGVVNAGTMNNIGVLINYAKLVNSSGTLTNNGNLINYAGTFNNLAGYSVAPTVVNNASLENRAAFANFGNLTNSAGATFSNSGTLTNSDFNLGRVFTNEGMFFNNAGGLLVNTGRVNNTGLLYNGSGYMGPGGTIDNSGTLDNSGLLWNKGTLANSGTLTSGALTFDAYGARTGGLVNEDTLTNTGTLTTEGLVNYATLNNAGTLINNGAIVNSGTFVVAAPVGGPLGTFTQTAGVLQGNSSMTQSAVTINGGRLMPGAPGTPGALTINANLTLGAGGVLTIHATPAQTSRVTVNGTASVAGTVELVAGAGTYPETRQTILSATGGVTGTFSGVTSTSAFLTPSLSYDPNSVFLSFYQSATFDSVAMTPNQTSVSTLLGTIQAGGGDADLQSALGTLSGLSAEQARAAYDSLAGAGSTSAAFRAQFSLADGFVRALTHRLGGGGSGGLAAMLPVKVASAGSTLDLSPATARDGAWVLAYGNDGRTNGDANAAGYRQDGIGVAFGADTTLESGWRTGAALNLGTQRAKLDAGPGDVKTDGVSLAAYARYSGTSFNVDAIAGLGRNGNKSTRAVDVGGTSRTANADYDSDQQFVYVEASYKGWRWEPVAALGYIRVDGPSYMETGAGGLSLAVDGQARESVKSYVGVRSRHDVGASAKLTARALWTHEFGDADTALSTARFAGAPAAGSFQTAGVNLERNGVLLGLSLSGDWRRNLSLFGDLSIETRQGQWNAAAFAGMRYAW